MVFLKLTKSNFFSSTIASSGDLCASRSETNLLPTIAPEALSQAVRNVSSYTSQKNRLPRFEATCLFYLLIFVNQPSIAA